MKFSVGVILTLLVSPASAFVQRPSYVFQRPTFRHEKRSSRSSTLQAVGIVDVYTAIAADPEVATAVGSSLGLLDVAVFLVPLTALAAGATAISQRDLIRSEIDTTERTLAETKSLLEKSDQTIKISFATAAATFALAFAYELGAISTPETSSSSVSSSSSSGVSTVTKAPEVPVTKTPSVIASPKVEESQKPTKAAVKAEKPKVAADVSAVPPVVVPTLEKGPDNYDALFDKLTSSKSDEEKSETKEAPKDVVADQPKEKDAAVDTKVEAKAEVPEQPKDKGGVMDSLLSKSAEKPNDDGIVAKKEEAVKDGPKEVVPEQIKEQGGVMNSLMSKVSEAKENKEQIAKDSQKEMVSEQPKEKEGVVDSLMSKLSDKPKEESAQESSKEAAIETKEAKAIKSEEAKDVPKEVVSESPKVEVAKPEPQEVKKAEPKSTEEQVKTTSEPKLAEPAKEAAKEEPKKSEVVQEPMKIIARAPDLEPAKGGGVVGSLMQRLAEKQREATADDTKASDNSGVASKVEATKETAVKDKAPDQPQATTAPKEPVATKSESTKVPDQSKAVVAPKEPVASKVESTKETIVKDKTPEKSKPLIDPKFLRSKEDVKDNKAETTKETAREVATSPKTAPVSALAFEDSQLVIAGVAVASIGLAAILVTSSDGSDSSSPPTGSQPQASSGPKSSGGPPQPASAPKFAPKPSDASYLNSLNRETAALKNKGQVRGSYLDVIDDTSAAARLKGKKSMNSPYLESLPSIKLSSVDAGQGKMAPSAKSQQPPPSQPKAQPQPPQPIPQARPPMSPPPAKTEQATPPMPVMSEPKPESQTSPPELRTGSGGYLGALSGPPSGYSPEPKRSFSPMGKKYSSATSGTGASSYLENMSSRTFSQPSGPSYSSQPQNPVPPQNNSSFDPNGSLRPGAASAPPSAPQFGSSPGASPNAPIPPSGPPPPSGPGGPIRNFSQMGRKYSATQTGMRSYLDNISPNGRDNAN